MQNIKRLRAYVFLSVGIALLAYSLLAMSSLTGSSRAVLMLGSVAQPGSVVTDRIIATVFLLFLSAAGLGLIGLSVKNIIKSYKKQEGRGNAIQK